MRFFLFYHFETTSWFQALVAKYSNLQCLFKCISKNKKKATVLAFKRLKNQSHDIFKFKIVFACVLLYNIAGSIQKQLLCVYMLSLFSLSLFSHLLSNLFIQKYDKEISLIYIHLTFSILSNFAPRSTWGRIFYVHIFYEVYTAWWAWNTNAY